MIVDGKAIAADIYVRLRERRERIDCAVTLGIIVMEPNAAIESFVRIKTRVAAKIGVSVTRIDMPHEATTEEVIAAVQNLARDTDALIVQLPLPDHIDTEEVLSAIPVDHDVDVINPRIDEADRRVIAPVARAIGEVLHIMNVSVAQKKAVVVGAGRLVGAPTAALLACEGASVTVITKDTGSLEELKDADIVVLGAGDPGFVKPNMLKSGVVLIDAGTSESGGKLAGDADPACAEVASVITPVPGGIGPIAVAMIFENLFDLASV